MIFVHARKDTSKTAEKLADLAHKYETLDLSTDETHPQVHLMKKEVMKSRNKDLVKFFEAGFGIHQVVIVHVLVCTATLAWGANLLAHTVVIKIFGRAGRPQFDKSGEGIIITSHEMYDLCDDDFTTNA